MKILFLAGDAYGGKGGIAQFNRNLLQALDNIDEVEVVHLVSMFGNPEAEPSPEKIKQKNMNQQGKANFIMMSLKNALFNKPDLVICGHISFLLVAYITKRISGSKLWLIVHGIEAWQKRKVLGVKGALQAIDLIVAVSSVTVSRMLKWSQLSKKRFRVLPNTIDLTQFSPGQKPGYLLDRFNLSGRKIILTFGRLAATEQYKGHDEIIEALPNLVSKEPTITYVVAGDGDDRERLKTKVKLLGLSEHVIFAGYVPDDEKIGFYRLADLYAMPGRGEGFGIVFLEAMACGIPVLGSKLDGSVDALRNGELGILVDPDNQTELVDCIIKGLQRPRGVPAGLEFFSYPTHLERVRTLISQCAV